MNALAVALGQASSVTSIPASAGWTGHSSGAEQLRALSTAVLCSTVEALCRAERCTESSLCRHLAELADRFDRRDPALASYADVYQLARIRFGLGVRRTRERARMGRALRALPRIEQGFLAGRLTYSQVREVTRVATAADEHRWIQLAADLPLRVLERRVAEASGTSEHSKTKEPAELRWTSPSSVGLRMELPAAAWAMLERAMEGARRASEATLTDAEALEAVARDALAHQTEGGDRSDVRNVVVLYECTACRRTDVETGAGALELDQAAAARFGCGAERRDLSANGSSRVDRAVPGAQRLPAWLRRAVLLRDRMRCRAPGCRRRRYVDVHHIEPREVGGEHSRSNCITLCTSCHDRVHDGRLRIEGDAEKEPRFFDASGQRLDAEAESATPAGHGTGRPLTEEAKQVLAVMGRRGGWHPDMIIEASGLDAAQVARGLLILQLAGRIRENAYRYDVVVAA